MKKEILQHAGEKKVRSRKMFPGIAELKAEETANKVENDRNWKKVVDEATTERQEFELH